MTDQRQHPRQDMAMEVIVAAPGKAPMTMTTGNINEGGVFLLAGNNELPAVGTEIIVTLSEFLDSTEPMAMRARVVHGNEQGIGIDFIGPLT